MIEYVVLERKDRHDLEDELVRMDEEGWRVVGFSVGSFDYGRGYCALLTRRTEGQ